MKIKVKSWEDVNKTLNKDRETENLIFLFGMEKLCGTIIDVELYSDNRYKYTTKIGMVYYLHSAWCAIVEEEEDMKDKATKKPSKIVCIHNQYEDEFMNIVNSYLADGYEISSTSCGFVNSEAYDFCSEYQAILIKRS